MAGKAKSCYLSIVDRKNHKTVVSKVFFDAASMKKYATDEEVLAKYPADLYEMVKETY